MDLNDKDIKKTEVYAPVVIITCNRVEHLKECVESLSRCTYADRTEIYISVDYPPNEKYVDGWKKVTEYVEDIQGFKKVNVWIQETNLGPGANADFVRDRAFEMYDALLFTEDDNVFAPAYLDYMNQMLRRFEKDAEVYSIAGFSMLTPASSSKIYKNYAFQPWGYGTWKDKWKFLHEMDQASLCGRYAKNPFKVFDLYFRNKWLFCVYINHLLKGEKYARLNDAVLTMLYYLSGYYAVFPSRSLVKNNGFDGSGVNCRVGAVPDIDEVKLDDEPLFQYDTAQKVPVIRKWYLPIPDWAKKSAKLKNDPLTYILYLIMGRDRYLAWRKRKGI